MSGVFESHTIGKLSSVPFRKTVQKRRQSEGLQLTWCVCGGGGSESILESVELEQMFLNVHTQDDQSSNPMGY